MKDVTGNATYCDIALNKSSTAVNIMEDRKNYPTLKDMDADVYDAARSANLCVGNQKEADIYGDKFEQVRTAKG